MDNSSSPLLVIVAVFDHENGATATMHDLKYVQRNKRIALKKAAILRCQEKKLLRFIDVYDMRPGMGAVLGGVIGGFIGLLDHAVIVPLTVGVMIGTLAAKLRESGFPEDDLAPLRKTLRPGTSVIVAEIEPGCIGEVEWLLQQASATVSIHQLQGELVSSLESCNEVQLNLDSHGNGPILPGMIINSF